METTSSSTPPCAICAHAPGDHFTTFDASASGCAADTTDDPCHCEGLPGGPAATRVIVDVIDGQVTAVHGLTDGAVCVVRDYDVPGDWDDDEVARATETDANGDRCQRYTVPSES